MKVLFIDTPGGYPPSPAIRGKSLSHAISCLATLLIEKGHCVSVLDMNNHHENVGNEAIVRSLRLFCPDAVCFSVLSIQYNSFINAVTLIRQYSDCLLIAGGAAIALAGEQVFEDTCFRLNVAVPGEGDLVLPEVISAWDERNWEKLRTLGGILLNQDRKVLNTGRMPYFNDLDSLPFENLGVFGIRTVGVYEILASRGCSFHCSFCYNHAGHTLRRKSPERILAELVHARHKYQFCKFRFVDAFFNHDEEWVVQICNLLNQSELRGIPWEANGIRADCLSEKICKAMSGAGCEMVGIGVESFHPEVFRRVRKGTTLEQVRQGIMTARKHFSRVVCYMIIGLEGDTLKNTLFSYRQIRKLKPLTLLYCLAVPFPGTKLFDYATTNGSLMGSDRDSLLINFDENAMIAFETPEFTVTDRRKAFKIIKVKEFTYISWVSVKYPKGLLKWLGYALRYDTLRFPLHLIEVYKQEKRLKRLFTQPQTFVDTIHYDKVPDGTWCVSTVDSTLNLETSQHLQA
jgi:radical SAM superfamily enzyme YgiQ (UPF0313 family)